MNHAEDDFVLVHDDFISIAETLADQIPSIRGYIQLCDDDKPLSMTLNSVGEYEDLLDKAQDKISIY